jgi:hypothetical protein
MPSTQITPPSILKGGSSHEISEIRPITYLPKPEQHAPRPSKNILPLVPLTTPQTCWDRTLHRPFGSTGPHEPTRKQDFKGFSPLWGFEITILGRSFVIFFLSFTPKRGKVGKEKPSTSQLRLSLSLSLPHSQQRLYNPVSSSEPPSLSLFSFRLRRKLSW